MHLSTIIENLKKTTQMWSDFRNYYKIGQEAKPNRDQETQFLENKKLIAMLHDGFMEQLPDSKTATGRGQHNIGKLILEHVIRCVTLKHIKTFYENDHKNFEKDWDKSYMLLNETIDKLESKREALSGMSQSQYAFNNFKAKTKKQATDFMKGPVPRYIGFFVVIFVVPVIIQLTGLYNFQNIYKDIPFSFVEVLYIPVEDFWRTLDKNLPYTKIGHLPRSSWERDKDHRKLKEEKTLQAFNDITNESMYEWNTGRFTAELMEGSDGFQFEKFEILDTGEYVEIYLFCLKDSEKAKDFESSYHEHVAKLDSAQREEIETQSEIFRKLNFVGFFVSGNDELRTYYRNEFNTNERRNIVGRTTSGEEEKK